MSSEFKLVFKQSFIYGLGNIISRMISFVMIPIYLRKFSPADYGLIELLENTMNIIGIIVGMGLASAILRFYTEDKTKEGRDRLISTVTLFTLFISIVVTVVGIVYAFELSSLIFDRTNYSHPFKVMMFIFFFNSVIEVPMVLIRAKEKTKTFITVNIARFILACTLNILFIVVLNRGVGGWLLSSLWTSIIICSYLVVTTLASVQKISFSFSILRRMAPYALPLIPASLAMFWVHNGDRYVLAHVFEGQLGMDYVGIYSLGYKFAFLITSLVSQPFFMAWNVRMFYIWEQEGGDRLYARFFTYFVSFIIMCWLVLSVVIKDTILLLCPEDKPGFQSAYLIVALVAFGYLLRECSDFFKGVLLIKKRTSFIGYYTVLTAIISTILYLVLIPRYDIWGAAWATFITFALMMLLMFAASYRVHKVPYEFKRILVLLVLAFAMFQGLGLFELEHRYYNVLLKGSLCLAFYPILYFIGFFTAEEKSRIDQALSHILGFFGTRNPRV
jgi:O-antigen/teichoic acid export membrane protein